MARQLRDAILAAQDLKRERVDMRPFGWPGHVVMCEMTAAQRDEYEASMTPVVEGGVPNYDNLRARAVAPGLLDDEGDRQFQTPEEVVALGKKSAAALNHLFSVYQRLNGAGTREVEALIKNSVPSPGATTSSG